MALVFKEAVRSKRQTNKTSSVRDLLATAVAEYNRQTSLKARLIADSQFVSSDLFIFLDNKFYAISI